MRGALASHAQARQLIEQAAANLVRGNPSATKQIEDLVARQDSWSLYATRRAGADILTGYIARQLVPSVRVLKGIVVAATAIPTLPRRVMRRAEIDWATVLLLRRFGVSGLTVRGDDKSFPNAPDARQVWQWASRCAPLALALSPRGRVYRSVYRYRANILDGLVFELLSGAVLNPSTLRWLALFARTNSERDCAQAIGRQMSLLCNDDARVAYECALVDALLHAQVVSAKES